MLDDWRWPLLSVAAPNWPPGTNAERFDIVPVVALLGKIIRSFIGETVNPYPLWITACFALNAAALAMLVRALGRCGWLAMLTAGAFGAIAPVVQARFGHLGLIAQWLPIFALALYFNYKSERIPLIGILLLCMLSAAIHLYLYVMTAAIGSAIVLQALLDRRCRFSISAAGIAGILLSGVAVLWMTGILGEQDLHGITGDYRRYSMNLMSPFWPQTSGLFGWTGIYWLTRGTIGAVPSQYEGFCYLGAGGILLVATAAATGWYPVLRIWRAHVGLLAALAVLTILSLTDCIYLGPFLILSYEIPSVLTSTVLSWFRSCGRMFWPVAWLLLAHGIAGSATKSIGRWAPVVLGAALLLQWIDVSPWRARFALLTTRPALSVFGSAENGVKVDALIGQYGAVSLFPPIGCSSAGWDYASPLNTAAMEVQLRAARSNARMRHPYLSRAVQDCDEPDQLLGKRVTILLHDPGRIVSPPSDAPCTIYGLATVCVTDTYNPPHSIPRQE